VTVKSEAIACARGDAGHPSNRVGDKKRINQKKWRAKEEMHKGLLTPHNTD
jgi:hypothetical protein